MAVGARDQLRADVLAFLVETRKDCTLTDIARGCAAGRDAVSLTLDVLIQDGLVDVRHPLLGWLLGPLSWLLVGAERYSVTDAGLHAQLRGDVGTTWRR